MRKAKGMAKHLRAIATGTSGFGMEAEALMLATSDKLLAQRKKIKDLKEKLISSKQPFNLHFQDVAAHAIQVGGKWVLDIYPSVDIDGLPNYFPKGMGDILDPTNKEDQQHD